MSKKKKKKKKKASRKKQEAITFNETLERILTLLLIITQIFEIIKILAPVVEGFLN